MGGGYGRSCVCVVFQGDLSLVEGQMRDTLSMILFSTLLLITDDVKYVGCEVTNLT